MISLNNLKLIKWVFCFHKSFHSKAETSSSFHYFFLKGTLGSSGLSTLLLLGICLSPLHIYSTLSCLLALQLLSFASVDALSSQKLSWGCCHFQKLRLGTWWAKVVPLLHTTKKFPWTPDHNTQMMVKQQDPDSGTTPIHTTSKMPLIYIWKQQ